MKKRSGSAQRGPFLQEVGGKIYGRLVWKILQQSGVQPAEGAAPLDVGGHDWEFPENPRTRYSTEGFKSVLNSVVPIAYLNVI